MNTQNDDKINDTLDGHSQEAYFIDEKSNDVIFHDKRCNDGISIDIHSNYIISIDVPSSCIDAKNDEIHSITSDDMTIVNDLIANDDFSLYSDSHNDDTNDNQL